MKLRLLIIGAVLLAAACTGLYLDKGNAFPCDYALGPETRDTACVHGDACGTDNLCHPYTYEGPRFEGQIMFPVLDEGTTLHPRTLDAPVVMLAASSPGETASALVGLSDGRVTALNSRGQVTGTVTLPPGVPLDAVTYGLTTSIHLELDGGLPGLDSGDVQALAFLTKPDAGGVLVARLPAMLGGWTLTPQLGDSAHVLHATTATPTDGGRRFPTLQAVDALGQPGTVGLEVLRVRPVAREIEYALKVTPYPAWVTLPTVEAVDVGLLTRNAGRLDPTEVVAARVTPPLPNGEVKGSVRLLRRGGSPLFEEVAKLDAEPLALRFNVANTVMTIDARRGTTGVLSTWQVGVTSGLAPQHELVQAWPDCAPCGRAALVRSTPAPPQEGLAVDVLCRNEQTLTLRRITGSTAVLPTDACIGVEVPLPLDVTRVNRIDNQPVTAERAVGFVTGGTRGELWAGETLSSVQPMGLERVPRDVFSMTSGDVRTLGVLTDRYPAVLQPPSVLQPIGFRRFDPQVELDQSEPLDFLAAIHGVPNWSLLSTGRLARLTVGEEDAGILFSATLTMPSGDPIKRTAGGEAFVENGHPSAFFVTADDGLYFVPKPEEATAVLTPVLQPEPSVPIRSLALERTPLGTNGLDYARGYLVTSRNLYSWSFGGSPARWKAVPLPVAAGEPTEVWFDTPRSAIARVGYSDGRIFTLPGGYQLANALPGAADAGVAVKLLDYENYGGWPVALATTGLFVAEWDAGVNGAGLDNKFANGSAKPMNWMELALPDGGKPWARGDDTRGKLFVDVTWNDVTTDAGAKARDYTYALYVFLDDQVLKLGEFTRR